MTEIKIKKETVLSDKRSVLKEYEFDIKQSNGEWSTQKREIFDHGNAATVLLYNREKQTVLLTRQFRLTTHLNGNEGGMLLEACAGILEEGEPPAETMIREIEEETGFVIESVQELFSAYSSPGAYAELLHYFVAPYTPDQKKEKGGGLAEEGEDVTVVELPFTKALEMIESGEIRDGKTILLLYHAKLVNLLAE